jgi:YD repeat-containing protein
MARTKWNIIFYLILTFVLSNYVQAQTATYHLHKEASSTATLFQLKTAGPDGTSLAVQSANLKNSAAGEYLIKAFDTQSGVPNTAGVIPAGSTITFTLWMKKTTTSGTLFPRAKLRLNSATGTLLGTATGTTALTSTLAKYTLTVTTAANISMTAADRFYVWVGVNLTVAPTSNTNAEADIEGTLNGNYDSQVVVPLPQPPPTISSLAPSSGSVGTIVTVSGSNFGAMQGTSTITFNGVAATPSSWNAGSINAPVPSSATTGPVRVTVNGAASNASTFTVLSSGTLNGTITRNSDGTPLGGALVEALQAGVVKASASAAANGTYSMANVAAGTYDVRASAVGYQARVQAGAIVNSGATTTVNQGLDAVAAAPVTYVYDENGRLVSVVGAAETVTYNYDPVGNILSVTRQNSTLPSILEFTPNSGPVGSTVTIYGTGFSTTASQNTVKFNGVAASVSSATATQIVTSVPAGATTGPITVITPIGATTSGSSFIVGSVNAPTINNFSPAIGAAGTAVTINGTNFETNAANNRVKFNITYPTITSATATTISTSVPAGATSGRISVATPNGNAVSSGDFFVPPSPYVAADVETTGRMAIGGSQTVAINTTDKIGLIVFDASAGQRVSLKVTASTVSGGSLTIYNPYGTSIASVSYNTSGGFIDTPTLPINGTYTILIDPNTGVTGSTTFTLYNATDATGTITPGGPAVTATTTTPGQNAQLTFNGTAGQRVSLKISGVTLTGGNGYVDVYIKQPDGTTLASSTYISSGGAFIDVQTLQTAGTYTVLVDPQSTNTGSVTLTLYDVPADAASPITPGGPAVTMTTTIPGQNAQLTFNGTAGQQVSLRMTGVTLTGGNGYLDVYIKQPDGTTLASSNYISSGGAYIDVQTLPVAGTYTILVNPQTTNTGSVTLTLYDVPADITGPITPGGAPLTITTTTPGQNARLTFDGTAGQRISLKMSGVTLTGGNGYVDVYIKKPDGTILVSSAYISSGGAFIDVQTLAVAGTYTILVDPQGTNIGSVTLTLYDVPPDTTGPITPDGPAVTVTNTVPGQNEQLTFNGTTGQRVSLKISGVTLTGGNGYVDVYIKKPDGTTLVSSAYISSGGAYIDVQALPVAGTYTILVDPQTTNTGSVTLTLYNVPNDITGAITPGGPAVTTTFVTPGQNAQLTFSGAAGQRVSLRITGVTLTGGNGYVDVYIKKPDGTNLASSTYISSGGAYIDVQTLPVAGTYTVLVDPQGTNTGSVTLTLYDVPPDITGPITPGGAAVTVTNSVPGHNAQLTFTGSVNQRVSLRITNVTLTGGNGYVDVYIKKPDGTTLASSNFISSGGAFIDIQTLPVAGTYTVLVDPQGTNTGSVTLTLYDVAADIGGTITPGGPAVTVTTTIPGQNAQPSFNGTAGQRVSLKISGVTLTGGNGYVDVYIRKPDGTTLASSTFISSGGGYIDVQTLPVAGTYSILVNPQGTNTGSVTLTLYDVPADSTGPITPGGAAVTVTNSVPGQNAQLTFSGSVNQRVSLKISGVTLTGGNGYVDVYIKKPDGTTQVSSTFISSGGAFIDVQTLAVAGTYTILVDPQGTNTGSVILTLYDVPADTTGTVTLGGAAVNASNSVPGQNAALTFSGTAGQQATVHVTGNTMGTVTVSLLKPDGTSLTSATTFGGTTLNLATQTLPVTGTYTIKIDPGGFGTGSMSVSVSNP